MLTNNTSMQKFSVQQLTTKDLETFKSIRLEALAKESNMFGSTYEKESTMIDQEWRAKLEDTTCAYFTLMLGEACIGITGIVTCRDNPSQAMLIASYIRKEFRGNNLSTFLYEARLAWARTQGFKEVIVSHRASNEASKKANQKHGFVYTHTSTRTWNDGNLEDELHYKLTL